MRKHVKSFVPFLLCLALFVSLFVPSAFATDTKPSPQEEHSRILSERRKHTAATRTQTANYLRRRDEKYSSHGISALQVKQLLYRDY